MLCQFSPLRTSVCPAVCPAESQLEQKAYLSSVAQLWHHSHRLAQRYWPLRSSMWRSSSSASPGNEQCGSSTWNRRPFHFLDFCTVKFINHKIGFVLFSYSEALARPFALQIKATIVFLCFGIYLPFLCNLIFIFLLFFFKMNNTNIYTQAEENLQYWLAAEKLWHSVLKYSGNVPKHCFQKPK